MDNGCGVRCILYSAPSRRTGRLGEDCFFTDTSCLVSVLAFLLSAGWSVQYLRTRDIQCDWKSSAAASLGLL